MSGPVVFPKWVSWCTAYSEDLPGLRTCRLDSSALVSLSWHIVFLGEGDSGVSSSRISDWNYMTELTISLAI